MKNNGELIKGAAMSYIAIIFNTIAGLMYTPWMLKQIGQSDYGLFVLATSFLSYFIMDFGLGNSISRFISKYRAENKPQKIDEFLGIVVKIYLCIAIVIMATLCILFLFINNIFTSLTVDEIQKLKVVYVIIGLYSVVSFPFTPLNGLLIAYERFVYAKSCDLGSKLLTIALMVAVLYSGGRLYGLVAVNSIVGLIMIVLKLIYVHKVLKIRINYHYWNKTLIKELISYTIWITVMLISYQLLYNIAPVILASVSGTVAISIFAIGKTIQGYVWTFADALNGLFMPSVARIAENGNDVQMTDVLMIKVGRIQVMIIGAVISGFVCFGKDFILLWVGDKYLLSYYVTVLLIAPNIISLTQEIANTKLYVVGEVKYRAIIYIVASLIGAVLTLVLSTALGAMGAAIGVFVAMLLCHVIGMNIVYCKVLNIDIMRYFRECQIALLLPLLLSTSCGLVIQYMYPIRSPLCLLTKGMVYIVIYVFTMWHIALNVNERILWLGLVRRLIH